MLNIHTSNRLEILAERLAFHLREQPAPVFEPQVVVTAGPAMARWLHLQLCRHNGIATHIDYPLPAAYIWSLARQCLEGLPDEDPLSRETMTWKIFAVLPDLVDQPGFEPIMRYLASDRDGIRRWQLSQRIADVFDRYQYYRPRLIRQWDHDETRREWQSVLWRSIQPQDGLHRVTIALRLIALLEGGALPITLPDPSHWFAVQTLPPMLVQVLGELARHSQIHLWLLSPTEHYWGDLKPERALIRKRMKNPEEAALWESGNLLLASWGRQGQAFQDLLLEQPASAIIDHHQPPRRTNLLPHLQADLFELQGDTRPGTAPIPIDADGSLQVHSCHSALRECQVLHDRLLAMMQQDPTLKPEDILVLVPEISGYAPFIEAVFQKEGQDRGPFIPWNLSDISLADEHPLIRIFLQLLSLPESRFTLPEVLGYLDVPEVATRFGLTGEDTALIRDWLERARVYWGLDGEHKRELGLPGIDENTWQQAFRRLFGGYAVGGDGHYDGIAPVEGVEGVNAAALGRFWQLLEALRSWSRKLRSAQTGSQWQQTLNQLLETFFIPGDDDGGRLQQIRDEVADLAEKAATLTEPLSPTLIRHWLTRSLGTRSQGGRAYSGGVTFCGLQPLRGVPFRVICLLGMQDAAFPRRDNPAEFDRMQECYVHGDPHPGDEDRALFLETLLAARDKLYISYTGRAAKDDGELQPSVLVRELLDYLDRHYITNDGQPVSGAITIHHPLQPFSPRNYDAKHPFSFDPWWLQAARALGEEGETPVQSPWPRLQLPAPAPDARSLGPQQLIRFLVNPSRGFVRARLRLYLEEQPWEPDSEPFELDTLASYQLRDRLVADWVDGKETTPSILRAEGLLPHGAPGEKVYVDQCRLVEGLVEKLKTLGLRGRSPEPLDVSLVLSDSQDRDWRLQGRIRHFWPDQGLIRFRPAKIKGRDVLGLWVEHLFWILTEGDERIRCSRHIAADGEFILATDFGSDPARGYLTDLLELYWEGLHRPIPVFERASWAWASVFFGREADAEKAMRAAQLGWQGKSYHKLPGDLDDPYVQLLCRGISGSPLESPEFPVLAGRLYRAVFQWREQAS